MRLKIAPDSLLERAAITMRMLPEPLGFTTMGIGYSRSLVAAVRLGIFEALIDEQMTAEKLAAATHCSPAGIRALANALAGIGALHRRKGKYSNSKMAKRWLLKGREGSVHDFILFMGWCEELMADLEDSVRSGSPKRFHDREMPQEFWESYMRALGGFAKMTFPEINAKVKFRKDIANLLDVGGGHGLCVGSRRCSRGIRPRSRRW